MEFQIRKQNIIFSFWISKEIQKSNLNFVFYFEKLKIYHKEFNFLYFIGVQYLKKLRRINYKMRFTLKQTNVDKNLIVNKFWKFQLISKKKFLNIYLTIKSYSKF